MLCSTIYTKISISYTILDHTWQYTNIHHHQNYITMAPSSKNPSHGQKVDLGRRAPETHEGVGDVDPSSLAAESAAFQASNEVSEGFSSTTSKTSSSTYRSMGTQSSSSTTQSSSTRTTGRSSGMQNLESQASSGMAGQQQQEAGRRRLPGHNAPHGRNLHEDNDLSGENASFTQYGTEADPAYLAERKFEAMDSMPAGSTGGAGREKRIDDKNIYDALGSESNA